jgi:hypothetical protein
MREERMMTGPQVVRACPVIREPPAASVMMTLHRVFGISQVRRRIEIGEPMLDVELFCDDDVAVTERLRTLLDLFAPYRHTVHECLGEDPPSDQNRIEAQALLSTLDRPSRPGPRPFEPYPSG